MEQKIKVGDLVEVLFTSEELYKDAAYAGKYTKGCKGVVEERGGSSIRLEGDRDKAHWLNTKHVKLLKTPTPRRHVEMIIAWAKDDSLVVEAQQSDGTYVEVSPPLWEPSGNYRFKPSEEEVALEKERQKLSSQIKELQIKLDKLGVSSL
jgi:hypothetical protein